MRLIVGLLLAALFCAGVWGRRTAEEWRTRRIYQILTDRFAGEDSATWEECGDLTGYCNGNFYGLIQYLDYIIDLGFNAIWISPHPEHVEGDYHGYSATDFYSVSHHWGGTEALHELVREAHARDVWIMIDAVPNHMGIDVYGEVPTEWYPFNQTEHYHTFCEIFDWGNQQEIENCWIFGLPDLNQENAWVTEELGRIIAWTFDEFDLDGMRIDTVRHIPGFFWYDYVEAAGDVYEVGEIYDRNVNYVFGYTSAMGGALDAALNYPLHYEMLDVFQRGQTMTKIADKHTEIREALGDTDSYHYQGSFVDNHDNPRFLCNSNSYKRLQNYILLNLAMEGIPIFYYGTEQGYDGCGDPQNRESLYPNFNTQHSLYQFTATTNQHIAAMGDDFIYSDQVERWIDSSLYAFTRGQSLVISTNVGETGDDQTRTITYHDYDVGTVLVNIYYPDVDRVTVEQGGITVTLIDGEAKVYVPEEAYRAAVERRRQ